LRLDKSHEIAVLEMGMSNFGEIHNLSNIAKPDIAVITNIGVSHIEYLKTRENILKAKLEITDFFSNGNTLIINNDNDLLSTIASNSYKIIKVGVDTSENVDLHAVNVQLGEGNIQFAVCSDNETSPLFKVDVPGKHNVQNALLAIACGKKLNLSYQDMVEGIKSLEVTSMRLDIVKGKNFTIIDDSYNASPDSMRAALDVLSNVAGERKIAVLGTMKELGDESYTLHHEVGEYAGLKNIDLLITVGEFNKAFKEGFNRVDKIKSFENNEDAYEY
jgi:UDP-N-acetylmuramoyl-tripeptide--D-alanyl-D-alanine ligase